MGIAKNGPNGQHTGKIGNVVYYMLNGKNVVREIGINTKPPTEGQLNIRMSTKLLSEFLSRVLDFINTGFSVEQLGTDKNAFNLAMAHNRKQTINGIYPQLKIAYDKVILSKGRLKQVQNLQVSLMSEGLLLNWDTDPQMPWTESADQVMILMYFPEQQKAVYTLSGSSRLSGKAELAIPPTLRDQYMETYVSFIASDRKQLADSVYTGHFNKPSEPLHLNP